jgi:dihydrofolate reductase
MRKLIYSMSMSLDGFIADPGGEIDWSVPDDELFRFHTDQVRELGGHLLGRRLYETMVYWETAEENPSISEDEREFARIWKELPKVAFSRTLETVVGNIRLVRDGTAEEVARLKEEPGKDLAVGGAGLAAGLMELGLIDEFRPFVIPVVLGGGTPFFPALDEKVELELVDTRKFGGGVVYLRYRRKGPRDGQRVGNTTP